MQAADLAGASALSAQQLQEAHARIVERMAERLSDDERQQLSDDRHLIELAAVSAPGGPIELPTPLATPDDFLTITSRLGGRLMMISADPLWIRQWIERTFAEHGLVGGDPLINISVEELEDSISLYVPYQPIDGDDYRAKQRWVEDVFLPELRRQVAAFTSEVTRFEDAFRETAHDLVSKTLEHSRATAQAELDRYVDVFDFPPDSDPRRFTTITAEGMTEGGQISIAGKETEDAQQMADAAAELAANQHEIDRMRARAGELQDIRSYRDYTRWYHAEVEPMEPGTGPGAGASGPIEAPSGLAGAPDEQQLPVLLEALYRLIKVAELANQGKIEEYTARYPLFASYKRPYGDVIDVDADALDELQGAGRGYAIWKRIIPVLVNVARTQEALDDGDLNIWKEPRVVSLTMSQMLVVPGTLRGLMVDLKIAHETKGSWTDWAIAALTLGLAVLAAIPTGGSSVVAGVVLAADIAGAATDLYLIADHVKEYELGKAKAGTDLDAARAISADRPSFFWLALDIIGTGIGLAGAVKTFGHVAEDLAAAAARRLSKEEIDIAVARVYRYAREGQLSADGAERVELELRRGTGAAADDAAAAIDDTAEVADQAGRDAGRVPDADELDAPVRSRPRVDVRTRITPENLAALEERLGVPVEIDDALSNGVELHYTRKPGALGIGTDIEPTVLRVGPAALVDDLLAHGTTIRRVTKYNGVVGKLRGLWDRFVVGAEGGINPFQRGTRGWEAFEEMRKLDDLVELRRALWNPKTLDALTLDEEIAFLEGRRAYYSEIVESAEETGAVKGVGRIDAPDVGAVTREAEAKGYRLPGTDEGANPDHYYYRNKRGAPGEYELAVKPSAPTEAPSYRAVTKDGAFESLEAGEVRRAPTLVTSEWTDAQVIAHLRSDESFASFAAMLEREGLATPEEIDAAIVAKRGVRDSIADSTVRHNAKEVFRSKVEALLTDKSLDAQASWQRMREIVKGLDAADRGSMAEIWYQARYAEGAESHVAARVARTGAKAGEVEDRVIDLVEGQRAIEMKDVAGPIDRNQFRAYMDMVQSELEVMTKNGETQIKRLRYVFTRPEGARANLTFFAEEFQKLGEAEAGQLSVVAFDAAGTRHLITSAEEAKTVLAQLGGPL
jgi:hypothetical protein